MWARVCQRERGVHERDSQRTSSSGTSVGSRHTTQPMPAYTSPYLAAGGGAGQAEGAGAAGEVKGQWWGRQQLRRCRKCNRSRPGSTSSGRSRRRLPSQPAHADATQRARQRARAVHPLHAHLWPDTLILLTFGSRKSHSRSG